jgi:hypothetical protein
VAEGEPRLKAQCHCRECQYISGGGPNLFMLMAPQGFRYTSGEPRKFSRSVLVSPVTREFCGEWGTHLTTRRPGLPLVILKVGTLIIRVCLAPSNGDLTVDKQPFHVIPDGPDIRAFAAALTPKAIGLSLADIAPRKSCRLTARRGHCAARR